MNQSTKIGVLSGVIVLALGIVAFFLVRGSGSGDGKWTNDQRSVVEALEKAGGDVNKLDAETRKRFDTEVANNPMSTSNRGGKEGGAAMIFGHPTAGSKPQ